ncbi:MAG: MFS transporter [Hyphomicrobiaceae bacterium]
MAQATAAHQTARERLSFFYLNIGHFLDHLFTLVYATVAALALHKEWGLSYAELVPYATPGFIAFGLFSLPAGRLADKWSRHGMMVVFFIGIGLASIATGFAQSPWQIGVLLFIVGVLAAIYHPVGLAMVVDSAKASGTGMAIGINGVWGNLGVGSAALITGWFIDHGGWRAAFIAPGILSILIGIAYWWHERDAIAAAANKPKATGATSSATAGLSPAAKSALLRLTAIVFFTTAVSSLVFQSTTFALPKVFAERLQGITGLEGTVGAATTVGWLAFVVFAIASVAQLIVGTMLDKYGPRLVFMAVAAIQVVFFWIMPGLTDWWALAIALGFMLGAFGQIPINDYMIGRMAKSELRATIYGVRYVVSFTVLAAALPLIAYIHGRYGFDVLFRVLSIAAAVIFLAVTLLPKQIPEGGAVAAPTAARA